MRFIELSRRQLLQAGAYGSLPARRADQAVAPSGPGLLPAPSQIFRGRLVIIQGTAPPASGLFIYNAAGKLIGSGSLAGTAPLAGTAREGFTSYTVAGAYAQLDNAGLFLLAGPSEFSNGFIQETSPGQMTIQGGLANSGDTGAAITINDSSQAGGAQVILGPQAKVSGPLITNAATLRNRPAAPAGTVSLSLVMMGMGQAPSSWLITPASSGLVQVIISGEVQTITGVANVQIGGRFADVAVTAAPANGVAATGTRFGPPSEYTLQGPAAGVGTHFVLQDLLTLTVGHQYWFDIALLTGNAADQAQVNQLNIAAWEIH